MSLQSTPSAERLHIAFFGQRNAGKSSLVNAITGQQLSVVSAVKGTTTDPVRKAMELLPLGAVLIIDTPGFDDEGELGALRVEKTRAVLARCDVAVLVSDATAEETDEERAFLAEVARRDVPLLRVYNKADLLPDRPSCGEREAYVSARTGEGIAALREQLGRLAPQKKETPLIADLLQEGDVVVLVCPIDAAAPRGRLILPQQQTIRAVLDARCTAVVCQDTTLRSTLAALAKPPRLVITDSQAFSQVAAMVPDELPLTSFSILFARYKGDLRTLVAGASVLSTLRAGDRVLISEGCTHHRQCGDIGSVKIPALLRKMAGGEIAFDLSSGDSFPADLTPYRLIIHCGGCMLNAAEMAHRMREADEQGVPMVNYGVVLAHGSGVLQRSLAPFSAELRG